MTYRRNIVYVVILLSLVVGWLNGRPFLMHIAYVFAAVLIASLIFSWMAVNWLQINRWTYVRRLQVGDNFEETFVVRNTSLFPKLWLEVRDHSTLPAHRAGYVVPLLRGRRQYQWSVKTPCTRRGQFTLGPLTLLSGDPFGFYQFPRHISATSSVIVYPITVPIYDFAPAIGALSGGQAVRKRTYDTTPNVAGIREYVAGDALNRIHWRSSARRGKLMVKEFDLDPLGDVWIFLDLSQESLVAQNSVWGGADYVLSPRLCLPPSTEEYTIVAGASLARYFLDQNRSVGFLSYTPYREYLAPDRGDRQLVDILESLALAKSETSISLQQMLALEGHNLSRGTTLIVVTASTQTAWLAEAYSQIQRGMTVVAVMIDPESFGKHDINFDLVRHQVEAAGVLTYAVRHDDDLSSVLSYRAVPMSG